MPRKSSHVDTRSYIHTYIHTPHTADILNKHTLILLYVHMFTCTHTLLSHPTTPRRMRMLQDLPSVTDIPGINQFLATLEEPPGAGGLPKDIDLTLEMDVRS